VLSTLRPVCDCMLIRCVDLHTLSRSMFGQSCNFVLFSCLFYCLFCFHNTLTCYVYMYICQTLIIVTRRPYPRFRPIKRSMAKLCASPRIDTYFPPNLIGGGTRWLSRINTKHNKYNRHAFTNLKSLSLVTDVKKINISLRIVKNWPKHVGELLGFLNNTTILMCCF
jgi:hypothetical protein